MLPTATAVLAPEEEGRKHLPQSPGARRAQRHEECRAEQYGDDDLPPEIDQQCRDGNEIQQGQDENRAKAIRWSGDSHQE
jgi:hypothetical protein